MALIEWLHHGRLTRELAGGKGAALSGLQSAGFPIPDSFAVTADAYRLLLATSGLDTRIEELLSSAGALTRESARDLAATISSLILQTSFPAELAYQISSAYEVLATTMGSSSAVRSSATDEDGATRSMAGLYESYLNLRGTAAVLDAVSRCYASFWSERAIAHRAGRRSEGPAAMAVVVMSMVQCETAGVAFTAHPLTGDRGVVVINAGWGLGEAIVSGAVTPDSFVVRKDPLGVEEREIADKRVGVYFGTESSGTFEREHNPARAAAPSLTDDQALEVARTALAVESHYGTPQDVEWGIADGRLYVLQSRPITTL